MNIDLKALSSRLTPFYYYDKSLLSATLDEINDCIKGTPMRLHYALKANSNPEILRIVASYGAGADCVSGNEIIAAVEAGIQPRKICFAGVGKTDREINLALSHNIGCFNVESFEELEIIASLARDAGKVANVAIRVNPNIDAHTHEYITTGLEENKFGIDLEMLDKAIDYAISTDSISLTGLHFHIGSQITTNEPFKILCERINSLQEKYSQKGITFRSINVGGGLGIDYDDPDANPIPYFRSYFKTILNNLNLTDDQTVHCELGRAVVAQCGSLITKVVIVKNGTKKRFVILDAGMSDLIRPALYGAHHKIENLSAEQRIAFGEQNDETEIYDVVGPICESSDVFGKDEELPVTKRGDIIALRSAGAYGEVMASRYNMRELPYSIIS